MKIKRIKKLRINSIEFNIVWDNSHSGGSFSYGGRVINIGTKTDQSRIFQIISHELMEICSCEMFVRFNRLDVDSDYVFVYDHRQFATMMEMFTGLLMQFIK